MTDVARITGESLGKVQRLVRGDEGEVIDEERQRHRRRRRRASNGIEGYCVHPPSLGGARSHPSAQACREARHSSAELFLSCAAAAAPPPACHPPLVILPRRSPDWLIDWTRLMIMAALHHPNPPPHHRLEDCSTADLLQRLRALKQSCKFFPLPVVRAWRASLRQSVKPLQRRRPRRYLDRWGAAMVMRSPGWASGGLMVLLVPPCDSE